MERKEEIIEKAKTDLTEIIKQRLLAVGGEEEIDVILEYIDPEDYRVTTEHIKKVYVDEDGQVNVECDDDWMDIENFTLDEIVKIIDAI